MLRSAAFLMSTWHPVIGSADLADGHIRTVHISGKTMLLVRVGGQLYAATNLCPHAGSPLNLGKLIGRTIRCPLHGFRFDLETGGCLGPAPCGPLETYETVERDEIVFLRLPAAG